MHELSVAQSIVDIVHQYIPEPDVPYVRAVRIKLGKLAGIVPDSLDFSFSALTARTSLHAAHLEIDHIPFILNCKICGKDSSNDIGHQLCSHCGGADTTILSGRELQVMDIELADAQGVLR
ncbi:MAG: hydrogenase maturation nickel metallochaperone HypA [bacterium]